MKGEKKKVKIDHLLLLSFSSSSSSFPSTSSSSTSSTPQGPCVHNQEALARSRLLDAVSGFLHVFAILQRKLYRDTSQVELLRELLGLQEEMFILLLSMLEGEAWDNPNGDGQRRLKCGLYIFLLYVCVYAVL